MSLVSHPLHALAERWRTTATELRDYGETTRAGVLERCAGELDGLMDEYLKPSDAAAEQGFYSEGAIRKMLSDGRLDNLGAPGRPLVRRGDVWGVPRRKPVSGAVVRRLAGMR